MSIAFNKKTFDPYCFTESFHSSVIVFGRRCPGEPGHEGCGKVEEVFPVKGRLLHCTCRYTQYASMGKFFPKFLFFFKVNFLKHVNIVRIVAFMLFFFWGGGGIENKTTVCL